VSDPVINISVLGIAQPAGSKRAMPIYRGSHAQGNRTFTGRSVAIDANPKAGAWKGELRSAAREQYSGPLLDGPLGVEIVIFVTRPAGHSGKRGLLPSAPAFPATRPDVLKLARGIEDALTGVLWTDDARIVTERIQKLYGEPAHVEVRVWCLAETVASAGLCAPSPQLSIEQAPLFAEAV